MCYCDEIKKMMLQAKETDNEVISAFGSETIYVKYCNHYDEYTFQYSWIIEEIDETKIQVEQILGKYNEQGASDVKELEVIKLGFVSIFNTNADYFCKVIEHCKNKTPEVGRDTKYIFFGKRVIQVLQFVCLYSDIFSVLGTIERWNDISTQNLAQSLSMSNVVKGVDYHYLEENNSVIFSLGYGKKKTIFKDVADINVPHLLLVDSILGIREYNLSK